ncbi:MAG: alkaline phosphatase family protein [Candidatus Parcubacteria bacterium]|nr:alkaline phosphatase family protein [Burkholderiales bacterium]
MTTPAHLPNYDGNGFVNLVASLAEGCGAAPRHPPLASLPAAVIRGATNIVFVIVDGLGDNYLRSNGAGGKLAQHRRGAISAVFPSTTASAITTSFTGATPLEHGLTGWFTYFSEAGCVGAPLPFQRRGERTPLGVPPGMIFVEPSFLDALAARSIVVSQRAIIDSQYNRHHSGRAERRAYDNLAGFLEQTVAAVRSGTGRKLVYAYWPEFDALSHRHGVASAEVRSHFGEIDAMFGELLARISGSDALVVLTADHGFLDSPPEESVELPAGLSAMLRFPLCGERRIAFCHVHDEKNFLARANDLLGDRADVRPSRELAEEGWFGTGRAHPRFAERIGDVALVMKGCGTVKDWVPGEPRHLHIGNHGGLSEDEMNIPLVVATA